MNQECRLKKIDEIRNYLIQKINRNELMSKKHKKSLQSFELYWSLTCCNFYNTGCVSVSPFSSLVGVPIEITSCTIGLKICVITAR